MEKDWQDKIVAEYKIGTPVISQKSNLVVMRTRTIAGMNTIKNKSFDLFGRVVTVLLNYKTYETLGADAKYL